KSIFGPTSHVSWRCGARTTRSSCQEVLRPTSAIFLAQRCAFWTQAISPWKRTRQKLQSQLGAFSLPKKERHDERRAFRKPGHRQRRRGQTSQLDTGRPRPKDSCRRTRDGRRLLS